MQITRNKDELIISFEYNPALVETVKTLESRKFNLKNKYWTAPVSHVKKVLELLTPLGFKTSREVLELYNDQLEKNKRIQAIIDGTIPDIEEIEKLKLPLFDFQKTGVSFLSIVESGICGDEPGLGKSIQSLTTALKQDAKKILIVCPSSLKLQWQEEIAKWVPDATVYVITGDKTKRNLIYSQALENTNRFFLLVNYELLLRDVDMLQRF